MAIYPKTTLSIKGFDTNNQSKSFSVGYVNPACSDGLLKQFAIKLTDLSNITPSIVYKTTQEDITNATTDTTVVPTNA